MKYTILFLVFSFHGKIFSQTNLKLSRINDANCETWSRVVDVRPESCEYEGMSLYPVYVEEFNYKKELPNNWNFMNSTGAQKGTYYGSANGGLESYDNNITVSNGAATFHTFYHNPPIDFSGKQYYFSSTYFNSWFKVRQGETKAETKLPANANFWPAFWLFGSSDINPWQEIDIYEFYDNSLDDNHCDLYSEMKMTIHGNFNNTHCQRGRKFLVDPNNNTNTLNYFNGYHTYASTFTDYQVDFFSDNLRRGYANKFYEGPFNFLNACYTHGDDRIPTWSYSCNDMADLPGVNWLNKYNHVNKDDAFPKPSVVPMTVLITNPVNENHVQSLINSWNNYSDVDKRMSIDHFEIWQPVNCGASYNIPSESDFYNQTSNTSFLGGNNITVGSGGSGFTPVSHFWNGTHKNFQFLAVDYIEFTGEVQINNSDLPNDNVTYLRAEIIPDCGTFENFHQKSTPTDLNYATEDFKEDLSTEPDKRSGVSEMDNGAIRLFPNPATSEISIAMVEEDYNDIIRLEIIDQLGRVLPLNKSKKINITEFSSGLYQLKFVFSHGYIVVKQFVKK